MLLDKATKGDHIRGPVHPEAFEAEHIQPNAKLWPTEDIPTNRNTLPAEMSLRTARMSSVELAGRAAYTIDRIRAFGKMATVLTAEVHAMYVQEVAPGTKRAGAPISGTSDIPGTSSATVDEAAAKKAKLELPDHQSDQDTTRAPSSPSGQGPPKGQLRETKGGRVVNKVIPSQSFK